MCLGIKQGLQGGGQNQPLHCSLPGKSAETEEAEKLF